ncbi:MAG: alanine racemase [Ilumatobacteraceae bacterium]
MTARPSVPGGSSAAGGRWAWAAVDLDAIAYNVRVAIAAAQPAAVWAVVKADAYGHGALPVAKAALAAGARGLCVALVQEGVELRDGGIAAPILILSEQPPEQMGDIVRHGLTPTLSSATGIGAMAAAVGAGPVVGVHLKIDTGMNRSGADRGDSVALADAIAACPQLRLEGVFTHLATADEPTAAANELQLGRFDDVLDALSARGHHPSLVHAANSAGAVAIPHSRFDMVRLGIAMYGIGPGSGVRDLCASLRPAMSLHARVSRVHEAPAGDGVSYGLRHIFDRSATVATVPIGYADGVPRRLFETGGEVLIHGRRLPIVGVVTMDQLMVDCTDLPDGVDVEVGDEVVLIGTQSGRAGTDAIPAEEWAERLGTIGYEIVCGISPRVGRR